MVEDPEPLSERELEILRLVATGASNKEIAQRLHIAVNTVKVHLRNIFAKLEVASRTEATMVAVRQGWVVVAETEAVVEAVAEPAPPPPAVEPPLSWFRRGVLIGAALLALVAAVLAWPRSTPSASEGGGLLPVGGNGAQSQLSVVADESQWEERAQMPSRRACLALSAWGGDLYAIGGVGPDGVTGAVEIYDPESDSWRRGSTKPTPVAYIGAAVLGERILVPGGCTDDGRALDVFEAYDPQTDTWTSLPALPRPLCAYALALHEERLYLFGGTDGAGYVATTWIYDGETWREGAPLLQPVALAAAAALEERVYLVGGYRDERRLASCAVYTPATDSWSTCPAPNLARSGAGLVALGGQLYLIGGGGLGGYLGLNERYDPSSRRWTTLETPLSGEWQGAGAALSDFVIYTAGGYSNDYLSLTLAYEPLPFRIFIPVTDR